MGGALKLHVFTGPTPHDVSKQLSQHVGLPRVPPRWSMGYHLCRRGMTYNAFDSSTSEMSRNNLPYDSDCIDERLSEFAFQLDDRPSLDLRSSINTLKLAGKRLMLSLPPQTLVSSQAHRQCIGDCFIQFNQTDELTGTFEEETVALPDFSRDETKQWWRSQLLQFVTDNGMVDGGPINQEGVLGGISLTRNSPYLSEVTCNNDTDLKFPYVPSDIR